LRDRKVLYCLCISVFELLGWGLSGVHWLNSMHGMSRGLLLRYRWSFCSDGCLCSGLIFSLFVNRVFELLSWNIFILYVFIELLKLSRGNLYDNVWGNRVHSMSRRIILRHHRLERSNCGLRRWNVLCCLINRVLELPDWGLSGHYRFNSMHGMPRGLVLCYDGSYSSDECLFRGQIL